MKCSNNTPGQRTAWASWFIFVNGLFALLVGLRYLPWMNIPDSETATYVSILLPGQFALLAWLAGLPLVMIAMLLPARRVLSVLSVLYAGIGIAVLATDAVAYSLYRFHLSAFVLELALGGGTEIFSFSWQLWASAIGIFIGILVTEAVIAIALWRKRPRARWLGAAFTLMFALQLGAHGWHAWAEANYDSRITGITRHVPLYYAATAKRFMNEHGLVDPQKVRDNQAAQALGNVNHGGQLNYPTRPLQCKDPARKLSVLMIVVEGARWDMLDPRWMPNIYEFAQSNLIFEKHYSNGNATKPGIFTLFYSLPASYWDAFTAAKKPPVTISRMQELGYQTEILGSATLVSPAFDQNVFSSIPDLRLETPGQHSWDRDVRITDDWLAFTRSGLNPEQPFFGFLFYDTPHNHMVPDDYPVKFQPYWETVNKLELDQDFNPELIKNNYKSTLHYVDNQVGRVLDDLRSRHLLDSTIVLITGDHGQEFNEYGMNYWGHGSNFGQYQLRVPMVVHWPGKKAQRIDYRTENFDIAPTLMKGALGCSQTPAATYATGNGLFTPREREWSIAHSYMDYALLTRDLKVVTHASGNVDVVNRQLEAVKDYQLKPSVTLQVLEELSRFYQ
ncbi:DUF3413 domain-containing protein [Marinobacter subterrani]|uniref:Membrane-anchored periplasmic protein YejM, alkaline phosphatase superfamily n=1 Tax=Marinobacter subterrani TaxID=1658765 RepID=A0A0J7J4R5_9GAMM|nr:DUF3413 domain-containing protein [Marinobacter subterrani]KMQ73563.1 Membrane-anchored periplasmic protein YejM, alkaline phosphatase superfamily [Marinobacter subterrani]